MATTNTAMNTATNTATNTTSTPSLQDNDFVLFGLPEQFVQNTADITKQWKTLQQRMHPDRFAGQGASAQRIAMQWSARINEAYKRLSNPLQRAAYLCALRGEAVKEDSNTAMAPTFLMQQMEWREALDEADSEQALAALQTEVRDHAQALEARCAELLDQRADAAAAAEAVREWMFVDKFKQAVRKKQV